MNKSSIGWMLAVGGLAFVVGVALTQGWHMYRAREDKALFDTLKESPSVWLMDMENASMPEGVTPAQEPQEAKVLTVPSQLSKIDLPEVQTVISRSGAEFTLPGGEEKNAANPVVVLPTLDDTAVTGGKLAALTPVEAGESKISMIEAPVEVQKITSLEQYRQFKRQARGSYPEVDFAKQNILVLQSTSNLPDKVFEIQTVVDEKGKRIITYRVSVFGLNQKTNTHSVAVVDKKDLPLELKQVL